MQEKYDDFDKQIHRAFVELGLLFPETEQEVAWALKAMEGKEIKLPDSLKEPPVYLLEKLRKQE